MVKKVTFLYLLIGGAAPRPPIGGGTEPLAAERACKYQTTKTSKMLFLLIARLNSLVCDIACLLTTKILMIEET
jgi:hypothetical protein